MPATRRAYQPKPLTLPYELAEPPRFRVALVAERSEPRGGAAMTQPAEVAAWLAPKIQPFPQEIMAAVAVDTRNHVIGWAECYRGTLNRAAVERLVTVCLLRLAGWKGLRRRPLLAAYHWQRIRAQLVEELEAGEPGAICGRSPTAVPACSTWPTRATASPIRWRASGS